jgi:hypothetical protein
VDTWTLLGQTLLQSLLLFVVVLALYDIAERTFHLEGLLAFCAAVVLLGVIGYLLFWLAWLNYQASSIVKIVVIALLVIRFAFAAHRRRLVPHLTAIGEPLTYVFLFFLIVLAIGYANGGLDVPDDTERLRFTHRLPGDNVIPLVVANALKFGGIVSPLFGDWLSSDRPPLQTGLYLLLTIRTTTLNYCIVAIWLQATYLFGVWGLAVAAGLSTPARRLLLLACCLLPTAILNTFFTWPKLLSVCYMLLLFALIFRPRPADEPRTTAGILIGALTALAMLSHGTSAFALIGFAAAVVVFWAWPPLKTMIAGSATLAALYIPWLLYQNFIDPPGNRLTKWHLAGVIDVDDRGFLATLHDSYGALSWDDYLAGRLENVTTLIGTWPGKFAELGRLVVSGDGDIAVAIRMNDFFQFLPSLHLFSLAVIVALVLLPFMRADERPQRAIALRMLVALLVTLVAFALLIFIPGQAINHQGTYVAHMLATAFAFTVLLRRAPLLALVFLALQVVTVTAAYAFTLAYQARAWPLVILGIAAALALFAYALAPTYARWRRGERPVIG